MITQPNDKQTGAKNIKEKKKKACQVEVRSILFSQRTPVCMKAKLLWRSLANFCRARNVNSTLH